MFTCTHRIGYIMISSLALAHRHICCYVMISFSRTESTNGYSAQFGKVTTARQHEPRMENVQIELFVVK